MRSDRIPATLQPPRNYLSNQIIRSPSRRILRRLSLMQNVCFRNCEAMMLQDAGRSGVSRPLLWSLQEFSRDHDDPSTPTFDFRYSIFSNLGLFLPLDYQQYYSVIADNFPRIFTNNLGNIFRYWLTSEERHKFAPAPPDELWIAPRMLPKVLLVCLIDLIAVKSALGWNHVSRSKFESIVSKKDLALVACKITFITSRFLPFAETKLIAFQSSRYVVFPQWLDSIFELC